MIPKGEGRMLIPRGGSPNVIPKEHSQRTIPRGASPRSALFLRQALSYAEEFPRLSNKILHPNTVYAVVKVLPKDLYNNIRKIPEFSDDLDSSSESARKKCIASASMSSWADAFLDTMPLS